MKKFFSLFAAVLFAGSMMAEGLLFEQTYPGNPSEFTNAYTKTFTITTGDYTLTYANINNGQQKDAWDVLRAGHKTYDSKATITSKAIAEAVSKVVIDFTQADANNTNKFALLVGDDATFANATEIVATIAVGEVAFVVESPAEGKFYQVVLDQKASGGSSNGFNRFDKIQFLSSEGGTPIVPEVYDTLTVAEAKAICDTLADKASSATKYYIEGYAINVEAYDVQKGNQIFYMADSATATDTEFEAYAAFPMKDEQAYPVLAGDKVRVFGKLKKYGTQLEIVNPTVEFLEEVEGDRSIEPIEPAKIDTINIAKALEIGNALADGATTEKEYVVAGWVVQSYDPNEGFTDQTWFMADQGGAFGEFEAFRCTPDYLIEIDQFVYVKGKIKKYVKDGDVQIEIAYGTATHLYGEGIENVVLTEKAQKVVVDGVIYIIRDNKMFNLQGAQVR